MKIALTQPDVVCLVAVPGSAGPQIALTQLTSDLKITLSHLANVPLATSPPMASGAQILLTQVQTLALTAVIRPGPTLLVAVPGSISGPAGPPGPPGPAGPAGTSVYANPAYPALVTTQEALDYLLYVAPQITSFGNNVGTVEIGSTVHAVNLSWSFNKAMTAVTLNGSPISPTLTAEAYTGLALTANASWFLTGSDGTNTASASTTVGFAPRRWWGTSPLTALTSAEILALGNSEFAGGRSQSRTFSASAAYLWFAWPSSFGGPASFVVNGLASSGWVETTISATNAAGYTQNYDCYRSQYLQNASGINVVVS